MNGRTRKSWEQTAIELAYDIAELRSEDPNTQVGACIIKNNNEVLLGYNGAPTGIDIDWSDRMEKRKRVIHAEENVLNNIKVGECKIFAVTHLPCTGCLRIIANKKIKTVYYGEVLHHWNPDETFKIAKDEYNIELIQLKRS